MNGPPLAWIIVAQLPQLSRVHAGCHVSSQMVFYLPTNDDHLKYNIQQKSLQDI